jgi:biotin carboxyl carrier protein
MHGCCKGLGLLQHLKQPLPPFLTFVPTQSINMLELTVNGKNKYKAENAGECWTVDDAAVLSDMSIHPNGLISLLIDGHSFTAVVDGVDRKTKEIALRINGQVYRVKVGEPIDQLLSKMGMDFQSKNKVEAVKAPMPGMVLRILVEPGQAIKKGDGLIVLEAMKMENILKAAGDAVVKSVKVAEKTAVEKGAVLIELGN